MFQRNDEFNFSLQLTIIKSVYLQERQDSCRKNQLIEMWENIIFLYVGPSVGNLHHKMIKMSIEKLISNTSMLNE